MRDVSAAKTKNEMTEINCRYKLRLHHNAYYAQYTNQRDTEFQMFLLECYK